MGLWAVSALVACAPDVAILEEDAADGIGADADEILEASLLTYAEARSFLDQGEIVTTSGDLPPESAA
ncbi:MAG TPA: hypothetical protein VJU61_07720, partial [Polyangiaceae bacterium]|nr:hypothetical protein [Polyangiaceae bacterium]